MYVILSLVDFPSVWVNFLFLLPFVHLNYEMWGQSKFDVLRILLVGLGLTFILRKAPATVFRSARSSHGLRGYLFFVAANVLSSINAGDIEAIYRSLLYLAPAMFFVISAVVVGDDPAVYKRMLRAVCFAALIVAGLAIVELLLNRSVVLAMGIPYFRDLDVFLTQNRFGISGRIMSTIGHPAFAGLYFVVLLVFCIGYVVLYRPGSKFLPLTVFVVGIFFVLITGSRAALLATTFVVLCYSVMRRSKPIHVAAATSLYVIVAIGASVAFPDLPSYLQESVEFDATNSASANISARMTLSETFLDIFRANPVLGYGPGLIQKRGLSGETPDWESLTGLENHYVVILGDGGLLAGVTYLLFMFGVFRDYRRASNSGDRLTQLGGQTVFLAFVGYFVVATSITPISLVANYLLMAVYGATMGRVAASETKTYASTRGLPSALQPESRLVRAS